MARKKGSYDSFSLAMRLSRVLQVIVKGTGQCGDEARATTLEARASNAVLEHVALHRLLAC
jgi:hypothetical protein